MEEERRKSTILLGLLKKGIKEDGIEPPYFIARLGNKIKAV